MPKRLNSYFGSVRFFKNLILLVVIVAILVPTCISISQRSRLQDAEAEIAALQAAQLAAPVPVIEEPAPPEEEVPPVEEEPAALSEPLPYQELYPDFYAPQPFDAVESTDKTIYLTFDDGPSMYTSEILSILEEHDVKATFFVIGHDDEDSRQLMRDIVDAGHTIGMHTYCHDYSYVYGSVENYLDDMYRIFNLIKEATGVTPSVFRFPGGSINSHNNGIYQELMAEMLRRGFVPYDWNLSAEDSVSGHISASKVQQNVLRYIGSINRGFILMHDSVNAPTTKDALPNIIEKLREMGYSFAPLTERVKPVLFNYQ